MMAGEILSATHSFPFCPLREMLEARPFIVIAPHPDDESLACGGPIADLADGDCEERSSLSVTAPARIPTAKPIRRTV
jgi:hypothetical protein